MSIDSRLDNEKRNLLAGEYVLGTLSLPMRNAVEREMKTDSELASSVRRWEDRLLPLNQFVEPMRPSARVWKKIEATLGFESKKPGFAANLWNSLLLWRSMAAGGLVAALALVTVLQMDSPVSTPRFVVVLVAPQDKSPGWVIQASHRQEVTLVPLAAYEIPPGKSLQFWTKADGWSGPVSLGLVKPGQPVQIPLKDLPPLQSNQLFELTLEPANGSPIGRPTGPIQFIGRASKVM